MEPRFVIRPDPQGYSIRDLLSGEPAILGGMPQKGLSERDAEHTAALLNRNEAEGAKPGGLDPIAPV
jgi:hypothetical protein